MIQDRSATIGKQGGGPAESDQAASPAGRASGLRLPGPDAMTPPGGVSPLPPAPSPRFIHGRDIGYLDHAPYREPQVAYHEPPVTEDVLAGIPPGPALLVKPCACGSEVIVSSLDIGAGVLAHSRLPEHRAWRLRVGIT